MRRDVVGTAVVVAVAVLALVTGAAGLQDALPERGPAADGADTDEAGGSGALRDVEGAGGGGVGAGSCPFCVSISLRGLIGGLLPALTGPVLAVVALVGAALAALSWRRATVGAGAHEAAETVPTTDPAPADATPTASPVPASQPPATNPIYAAWQRAATAVVAATPRATAGDDRDDGDGSDADGDPTAGTDALTPREHVALGRERGLDGGALTDLVTVFERVRYGDAPATEDRVERARDALGRIGIGDANGIDDANGSPSDERASSDSASGGLTADDTVGPTDSAAPGEGSRE